MEVTQFALGYAVITLLSCILCTSSFVAGILAKSVQSRPDSDQVMDAGSLRTVLVISKIAFYISSGVSGFLLALGAGLVVLWAFGIFP
ncbi:MAG: hypothetical protein ACPH3N_00715 [Alcanivorax sediminis]|uniref:hypothetical protein n=1 Tax=Alcanivorax sediminis TaxID=2663008 RepID=UPI003C41D8BB